MTPFKTIWPNFIIIYPIDSFQDHLNQILSFYTQVDSFQDHLSLILVIMYPIDSFQDHFT